MARSDERWKRTRVRGPYLPYLRPQEQRAVFSDRKKKPKGHFDLAASALDADYTQRSGRQSGRLWKEYVRVQTPHMRTGANHKSHQQGAASPVLMIRVRGSGVATAIYPNHLGNQEYRDE